MQNAHLPAVRFAPRAYMGCGGWDLARAPETTGASLEARRNPMEDMIPGRAGVRSFSRPRRNLMGAPTLPQVTMGCGEETCETCENEMGCTKCKRIRKNAARNQSQEMEGSRKLGQAPGLPDTSVLIVSGLTVAGLFYLALR